MRNDALLGSNHLWSWWY